MARVRLCVCGSWFVGREGQAAHPRAPGQCLHFECRGAPARVRAWRCEGRPPLPHHFVCVETFTLPYLTTLGRPPLPISLRSLSPILAATFMPPRGRPLLVVLSLVASSSVASLSSLPRSATPPPPAGPLFSRPVAPFGAAPPSSLHILASRVYRALLAQGQVF